MDMLTIPTWRWECVWTTGHVTRAVNSLLDTRSCSRRALDHLLQLRSGMGIQNYIRWQVLSEQFHSLLIFYRYCKWVGVNVMSCCGQETVPSRERYCQKWTEVQTNINKCMKNETRKWEREACSAFGFPSKNVVGTSDSYPSMKLHKKLNFSSSCFFT